MTYAVAFGSFLLGWLVGVFRLPAPALPAGWHWRPFKVNGGNDHGFELWDAIAEKTRGWVVHRDTVMPERMWETPYGWAWTAERARRLVASELAAVKWGEP